jgi:hypothetical protein
MIGRYGSPAVVSKITATANPRLKELARKRCAGKHAASALRRGDWIGESLLEVPQASWTRVPLRLVQGS